MATKDSSSIGIRKGLRNERQTGRQVIAARRDHKYGPRAIEDPAEVARRCPATNDLVKRLEEKAGDAHLPKDYARQSLDTRAMNDSELQKVFLSQFDGPDAPANWKFQEKRLGNQFAKAVRDFEKSRPDPDLTADAFAVAAAVRGTANTPPPYKPPNLKGMSNGELRKHVMDTYGYDPGV